MADSKMTVSEVLENEKKCVQRNIDGCDRRCATCDLVLPDSVILDAYDAAIAALREQAEREKGCKYCKDQHPARDCVSEKGIEQILCSRDGLFEDCYVMGRKIKFCPNCGRRLEVDHA